NVIRTSGSDTPVALAANGTITLEGAIESSGTTNVVASNAITVNDITAGGGIYIDNVIIPGLDGFSTTGSVMVTGNLSAQAGTNAVFVMSVDDFIMEDNTEISTTGGNITITAGQLLTVGDAYLSRLDAMGGNITITVSGAISDINDADLNAIAGTLTMTAVNGIGTNNALETSIDTLVAHNNGTGDIGIVETDDIILSDVDTNIGDINVLAYGSITATDVQVDSGIGDIDLIAFVGDLTATNVQTVNGNIDLVAIGGVTATNVIAGGAGDIFIEAVTGSVTADIVTALEDVVNIVSSNRISMAGLTSMITSADAILQAANGIDVYTTVTNITAQNTGSGDVSIRETDTLVVADLMGTGTGVLAAGAGDITINVLAGTLDINPAVSAGGSVDIDAASTISVNGSLDGTTVIANAGILDINSATDDINITDSELIGGQV
ncbi:hypothetical protein HY772_04875, partial [Candidatus Woesearchaeota archaeon]|nr:hypothetical protein [Candidatus Woesearchaeota archaeon]